MIPKLLPPRLLLRLLRFHVTSPYMVLWRTIEIAVMNHLAARQGLDLQVHVDLDVGCGNGVLGHAVVRDIGVGFDLEPSGVVWARYHKPAYRALLRASATAIPLAAGSQQFVFSNSVLEHIPDDQAALDQIAGVIGPGGYLLLSTVSEQFPTLMLGDSNPDPTIRAALDRSYAHYHYYSAAAIEQALAARGLHLLDSAYYINARQARWCHQLRVWEQLQPRAGLKRQLHQLRRAPIGLALVPTLLPLYAPPQAGAGLAFIARKQP
jgi:2-polyprenyl-3-methyl-5-hydroxy-6-metoxy-1,4-benzoquinol methylase